jgi:hypothetical protein
MALRYPDHSMQFVASTEQRFTFNLKGNLDHLSDPYIFFTGVDHLDDILFLLKKERHEEYSTGLNNSMNKP